MGKVNETFDLVDETVHPSLGEHARRVLLRLLAGHAQQMAQLLEADIIVQHRRRQ